MSFVDDLDAKVNMVALKAMDPQNGEAFTDKIFALENRKFYRGLRERARRTGVLSDSDRPIWCGFPPGNVHKGRTDSLAAPARGG